MFTIVQINQLSDERSSFAQGTRRALTFESADYDFLERFAIRLTLTGPRGFAYVVRYAVE